MKNNSSAFATKEVVTLVIITCIVSFIMGAIFFGNDSGSNKLLDNELNEFIEQYDYIVNNYYEDVDKKELINGAIKGMVESLGDDYSVYLEQSSSENFNITLNGSYEGIGISVATSANNEIVIVGVFDNSPASKAGLKPLDIIKSFDGEDLTNKTATELTNMIKKSSKKSISLGILRDGEEKYVTVEKDVVTLNSVSSKILNENNINIGYIQVSIFAENTYKQFKEQLSNLEKKGIDSLIIDLRGNSGGHLDTVTDMTSLFLDSKKVIYQIQTKTKTEKIYSNGKKNKSYPIYILIDADSASASEVMASALSEQLGAKLVGENSYGKGTVQEVKYTSSGDQYKFTTKKWLTSKGVWIKGKGLKPDIEIKLNEEYLNNPSEENDNQLNELIKIISNNK
ncbi:MAG: S41 family peptidase [Bacilli bacterium]